MVVSSGGRRHYTRLGLALEVCPARKGEKAEGGKGREERLLEGGLQLWGGKATPEKK